MYLVWKLINQSAGQPIPVVERSEPWVCGRSLPEIAGSNPPGMGICFLWLLCVYQVGVSASDRSLVQRNHNECLCVPLSVIRCNKHSLDRHLQRASKRGQTKKEWKKERKKEKQKNGKTVRKRVVLKYWDINQWFNFSLGRNKLTRLLFLCNYIGGTCFVLNERLVQPLRLFPGTFSTFMKVNSMALTDVEIENFSLYLTCCFGL